MPLQIKVATVVTHPKESLSLTSNFLKNVPETYSLAVQELLVLIKHFFKLMHLDLCAAKASCLKQLSSGEKHHCEVCSDTIHTHLYIEKKDSSNKNRLVCPVPVYCDWVRQTSCAKLFDSCVISH